jgi:hypothetical protein
MVALCKQKNRTACAYIHGVFPYFYVKTVEGERPITELIHPDEYDTYSPYTLGGKVRSTTRVPLCLRWWTVPDQPHFSLPFFLSRHDQ